jgi:large subunit ribosomal protein L15
MTQLNQLPKTTLKAKKRIGRGYGSGKGGHTVGRGAKGQKARSKVKMGFAGTKTRKSLLKRLPLLRGKGKLKSRKSKPIVVNLKYLNLLPKDSQVTMETLIKHGLVKADEGKNYGVKILGEGDLEKPLKVSLPVSQGARKKIEQAGGKVVINDQRKSSS